MKVTLPVGLVKLDTLTVDPVLAKVTFVPAVEIVQLEVSSTPPLYIII